MAPYNWEHLPRISTVLNAFGTHNRYHHGSTLVGLALSVMKNNGAQKKFEKFSSGLTFPLGLKEMSTSVILFGTYEGGVVGFSAVVEKDGSVELEQFLSTPCHIGCVRSLASIGRYAVTGGTDEMINVFDVAKRLQLGNMGGSVHTSTITALAVTENPALLVSGCEDGQIAITRVKDFQTLKSFKGHRSAVLGPVGVDGQHASYVGPHSRHMCGCANHLPS